VRSCCRVEIDGTYRFVIDDATPANPARAQGVH
jgi:hypothetical protein